MIRRLSRPRGFTFLEIMLVVVIIGIMVAIVGPRLVGKTEKAKVAATKQQMSSIKTSLQMYEMQTGDFPTSDQGLEALVNKPSGVSEDVWEPVMDEMPRDSWNQEFIYRYPGEHGRDYDLISKGADGREGTEDDITNYPKDRDASF